MALEDYTTYTEVDPNSKIGVTSNTITANGIETNFDAYVYDDKGAAFFDEDYSQELDFQKTGGSSGNQFVYIWGLANVVAGGRALLTSYQAHQIIIFGSNPVVRLLECRGGSFVSDDSIALSLNTRYWLTMIRDESIGANGQLQCFIYSDSGRTVLVDTVSVLLASKQDFRYVYAINSDNHGSASSWSGDIQNLDLGVVAVAGNINRKLGKGLNRGTMRGL